MAEAVVFSLASKILSAIASPALKKAYEKGNSIWEARDDLAKLQVSVETIHAVLLDAERKQESSVAVRNWIKRIKSVLYDAEDLFDEFATEDLIKQQMMEGKSKLSKNKLSLAKLDGSPLLQEAYIHNCGRLTSVEVKAPIRIQISGCPALKNLRIADPSALKEFETEGCPELEELYKHELATTQRVVPFQLRSGSGITIKRRSSEAPHISVADVSWSSDSDLYISPPSSQELKRRSSEAARISVADFYQVSWSSDSHLDLCSEIEL